MTADLKQPFPSVPDSLVNCIAPNAYPSTIKREEQMTEKGYSKVLVSPNRKEYERLHDEEGWGMVRLRGKALELGEEISTYCFWKYFKRTDRGYHPSIEEKQKQPNWGHCITDGNGDEGSMKSIDELR